MIDESAFADGAERNEQAEAIRETLVAAATDGSVSTILRCRETTSFGFRNSASWLDDTASRSDVLSGTELRRRFCARRFRSLELSQQETVSALPAWLA